MKKKIQFFVLLITFLMHFSLSSNVALGSYRYSNYSNGYPQGVEKEANLLVAVAGVVVGVVAVAAFVAGFTNGWSAAAKEAQQGEQIAFIQLQENSGDFSKFDLGYDQN